MKRIKNMYFCSAPRTSCTSHITTGTSTLTCNVVTDDNDSEDDEDVEDDSIEEMKAWWGIRRYAHVQSWTNRPVMLCSFVHSYFELTKKVTCLNSSGNTLNLKDLSPITIINVTLGLKSGRNTTKEIDLKKIGKSQLWAQTRIPVFSRKTSGVLPATNFWTHVLLPL